MKSMSKNYIVGGLIVFFTSCVVNLFLLTNSCAENAELNEFDHDATGFMLGGQHSILSCESCHIRGVFKGIPKTCEGCHERVSQIASSIKPVNHLHTTAACDDCHLESSWTLVRMDHSELTGSCDSCHNGIRAEGQSTDHIVSSFNCDNCHLTIAWVPARFDHSNITAACESCHNGTTATGKSPTHVVTSLACDDCHSTRAWSPARFDHSGITAACDSCHNGTTATGKPPTHVTTSSPCDDCHSTAAWSPASFDHSGISSGCDSCHNGTTATGKNAGHFVTTEQCNVCHTTDYWVPTLTYNHLSANYPGDHTGSNPTCIECHTSNSQTISWPFAAYAPECAACHAGDYRQDKHENLPVTDVLDCSGTCHKTTPEHNVRHSDWEN